VKRTGTLVICAMVLLCAGGVQANGIDPVIIVRGGSGTIPLSSPNFSLFFPSSTGPSQGCVASLTTAGQFTGVPAGEIILTCVFRNASPSPFTNLVITFPTTLAPLTVNCFGLCSSSSGSNNNTASFVFDPAIPNVPNVFPFAEFEVTFVAFNPGTTFTGTFNTPEPGTLALFGTGLLAIAKKLRKKKV
jgi:hypothetical protein